MLKVYYWNVCPHCRKTMDFLRDHNIKFEALDIETQPQNVVDQVIRANGGDDWVVPTLEYNHKWRKGKVFNPDELSNDLKEWGLL